MPFSGLPVVYQSLIVSRITYCLPVFYGYLTSLHINRINSMFRKALRWGLTHQIYTIESLSVIAERKLFSRIKYNPTHCLGPLLPAGRSQTVMSRLRKRGHNFEMPPPKINALHRNSFIIRCLFDYL